MVAGLVPLNFMMMMLVFYHLATSTGHVLVNLFYHFLSTNVSSSNWTHTLNLKLMRRVFYHCVTSTGHVLVDFVHHFLSAGFSGSGRACTFWLYDAAVSVLPLCYLHRPCSSRLILPFLSACFSSGNSTCTFWLYDAAVSILVEWARSLYRKC